VGSADRGKQVSPQTFVLCAEVMLHAGAPVVAASVPLFAPVAPLPASAAAPLPAASLAKIPTVICPVHADKKDGMTSAAQTVATTQIVAKR
jgi:hypothetical protein